MINLILLALFLGLAVFDGITTFDGIQARGIGIELNPFIQRLYERWGLKKAVWLGIGIPTLLFMVIGYHFPMFTSFQTGLRTTLFIFQLQNKKYVKLEE